MPFWSLFFSPRASQPSASSYSFALLPFCSLYLSLSISFSLPLSFQLNPFPSTSSSSRCRRTAATVSMPKPPAALAPQPRAPLQSESRTTEAGAICIGDIARFEHLEEEGSRSQSARSCPPPAGDQVPKSIRRLPPAGMLLPQIRGVNWVAWSSPIKDVETGRARLWVGEGTITWARSA